MKLATVRTAGGATRAVRVATHGLIDLGFRRRRRTAQRRTTGSARRQRPAHGQVEAADPGSFAPVVPAPGKVLCVGLNYRNHILEMGRELPKYPTLFAKYPEALIGATDDIQLPPESDAVDWEAELAVVLGARVRRATEEQAAAAIAGFAVLNDVTMRDWQFRSPVWLQGKTWEGSTPFGPYLVTPDELPGRTRPALQLTRLGRRGDRAKGRHLGPRLRPGRACAVRLHDPDAQPGRRDRDWHSRRSRPRPQAGALPHGRVDPGHRDRRAGPR